MPNPQSQIGMKGPFEIPYDEGVFAPVQHNLTIVGNVGIDGWFIRTGHLLFFSITITGVTPADTSASVAGTTYFDGLPGTFSFPGPVLASDLGTGLGLGNGCLPWPGQVYPPAWPASQYIEVCGFMVIA